MPFYVYILQSETNGSYYKGFTEHPLQRWQQHNNGEAEYTSILIPWRLVYIEELPTKREALIRERNLKKATVKRIQALLTHSKNIVRNFIG